MILAGSAESGKGGGGEAKRRKKPDTRDRGQATLDLFNHPATGYSDGLIEKVTANEHIHVYIYIYIYVYIRVHAAGRT